MTGARSWPRGASSWAALLPMILIVLVVYVGGVLWLLRMSLTSSQTFPVYDYTGLAQYARLFASERWLASLRHLAGFGAGFVLSSAALGTLLAVLLDQTRRGEGVWRTVFLYPYALSLIATGLVWQWIFDPTRGLTRLTAELGFAGLRIDWLIDPQRALLPVLVASVWQAAGLAMAVVLAGLRGVEPELWRATRVEGIPTWRAYASVVLPTLAPLFATVALLLATMAIKVFDAVIAMTQGGPGIATEVPAKFIMDALFSRANLGLAAAAAMALLLMAGVIVGALAWWMRRLRQPA